MRQLAAQSLHPGWGGTGESPVESGWKGLVKTNESGSAKKGVNFMEKGEWVRVHLQLFLFQSISLHLNK